MRYVTRILTLGMMTMLAFAGTAAAAGPGADAKLAGSAGGTSAHAEGLVDGDARYADADLGAVGDEAGAALDTDANVADVENAKDGGLFGWIEIRWSAFVDRLGGVFETLGLAAPETGAEAEVYVSDDGVDLDATLAGHSFDGGPAGDLDGKTFEASATAKGKVEEVKAKLPTMG